MKQTNWVLCGAALMLVGVAFVPIAHAEEVKLQISGMHACCPACIADIDKVLASVDGAKGQYNKTTEKAELTAKDAATAQKALDALSAAGFHGTTDNKDIAMKDDSGAPQGKVKSLSLTNMHICCGSCVADIKAAIKKVNGATPGTIKAHETTIDVAGDFDAAALIKALNESGYHAKVKN